MNDSFKRGAAEGVRRMLPLSVGLIPWALVTGVAMRSSGMSAVEATGMNLLVFAGTAQLGTLPLIASGAPLWLIVLTALALNLRFVIFSAAMAPSFEGQSWARRLSSSYLLVDTVFIICAEPMKRSDDPEWRWGCFLGPALWAWLVWQVFGLAGVLGADAIPQGWSLEFMATIALMVMLVPMTQVRAMLVAAVAGGLGAVLLRDMPLRLGVIAGIAIGIAAGFAAEHWVGRARAR
ncbi:MAG: AzlC family ABC transporter permease [Aromatoleum sp.]|jgi:predicted branched-subunit amino acid permease|uniref:AzlC family ABC transporter permease n=1 Tax=Aromatoleum sp. TaxID=2307007 RepID=UPI0028942019|nr:AzlC family ABC transporter permease [Aromatoleum sp.]MDT3671983.1 AzlC family ABC transporter permease [Aromatoleum sp.]